MELKLLNWLISFFQKLKKSLSNGIDELVYMKYVIEFGERDDDIYVSTFMKSGTTWMQMILYQLTTDGEITFNHIYDVSPWLRNLASRKGVIPKDLPSPRIIKMHDAYEKVPKGKPGRFIYVMRDGIDVSNSLWHHRRNYVTHKLSFSENFDTSFVENGSMNWFHFNAEWLMNKNKHKMLYVRYEDLKNDFDKEINRISAFIGITLTPEILQRTKQRASFSFMKMHETKFGEQPPEDKFDRVYDQFIRSGSMGEGFEKISTEELRVYCQKMKEILPISPLLFDYFKKANAELSNRT
jgi:hypothetical protein